MTLLLAAFLMSCAVAIWRINLRSVLWLGAPADFPAPGPTSLLERVRVFRRRSRTGALATLALVDALGAELAGGRAPADALADAARDLVPVPCPRALRAGRIGADVADALRQDSLAPGCTGLRALAACWEVAGHSGSGMVLSLGRISMGLRDSMEADAALAAELAAVRASSRLLALLPLIGLGLGSWVGAAPVAWLTGTPAGAITLVLGLLLEAAGLFWLSRIVRSVQGS